MIPSFSLFPCKQEAKTEKYFCGFLTPVSRKRGLMCFVCFFNSLLNASLLPCKAFSDSGKLFHTIGPLYTPLAKLLAQFVISHIK